MTKDLKTVYPIVISIPHAGTRIPHEIKKEQFSDDFHRLSVESSDHFTDKLYDFEDLINCSVVLCKTLPLVVNVNRHPNHLEDSVPLLYENKPIYSAKKEPTITQREKMIELYHTTYHAQLARTSKALILDGHSTTRSHHDHTNNTINYDIIVNDMQFSQLDPPEGIRTAPQGYLDTYIEELERRIPSSIKIASNAKYMNTYGHIMAFHGWDGKRPKDHRAPLILQETDESLYMKDGFPLVSNIEALRRIFAEALAETVEKMNRIYHLF